MDTTVRNALVERFDADILSAIVSRFKKRLRYLDLGRLDAFSRVVLESCDTADRAFLAMVGATSPDEVDELLGTKAMFRIITRLNEALPEGFSYCICAVGITNENEYLTYSTATLAAVPLAREAVARHIPPVIFAESREILNRALRAGRVADLPTPPLPTN